MLRLQRQTLRARPISADEFGVRAFAPGLFGRCVGVIGSGAQAFILEAVEHGRRLDRAGSEPRYQQLALAVWALHCAGHTPDDIELQRMQATDAGLRFTVLPGPGTEPRAATALAWARAFITGRRATAGLRADRLAPLVQRVLGGQSAAPAMLRARLGALPDVASWRAAVALQVQLALKSEIPRILVAADTDQALALHALVCEAALAAGVHAGDGPVFSASGLRLLGPLDAADCERRLGRLSPGPTIAIVTGSLIEVTRELEHVGQLAPQVQATGRGLFEWLRPLGVQPSLAVEELVPGLEKDLPLARQTMSALIERAGAEFDDDGPRLASGWLEHWQAIRGRRNALSVLEPDAARVAWMLALSPGGLSCEGVAGSNELRRGASMLQDIGLAARQGSALVPVPGVPLQVPERSTRRALRAWLAEREYMAPDVRPDCRDAWRIGLRLRGGDLSCWQDDGAEALLDRLVAERAYTEALQMLESHAAGALASGAGPPSIDALYTARDLAMSVWKPKRLRRLLRMWLRGYHGEWRALLLAIQAHVERRIGGVELYLPVIARCESACTGISRFAREQALIEAAHCCSFDDPAQALRLLQGVSPHPARAARYQCESRVLRVRSECEFVEIRIDESYALVQQAREKLSRASSRTMRARLEADIESRHMTNHCMLTFYKADSNVLLQPIREIEAEHGCCGDILRAAIVNDVLLRMRTWEVGLATPEQIDGVLAEARIDNLRGYMVALFQLEENAIHRGDCGVARQISARIHALSRTGDGNQTMHAGWQRHDAINFAVGGDWQQALHHWRRGRSWHIAEPWRTRTSYLRRGEWGFMLMLAGKWERAIFWLRYAFEQLAAMSAGGRGSVYFLCALLCELLQGRKPGAGELDVLERFIASGSLFARIVKPLSDAVAEPGGWPRVLERIEEVQAPEYWKAIALVFGVAIARRAKAPVHEQLAWAARQKLRPEWLVLRNWLESESPAPVDAPESMPEGALRVVLELRLPAENTAAALAQTVLHATSRATGAAAAAQIGLDETAFSAGAEYLLPALERAAMGENTDGEVCALGLQSPFGALATAAPGALPVLRALARRLSELNELALARSAQQSRRRQGRDAVRAAWTLASGDPSPSARLQALRALVAADTGADDVALDVMRGNHELLQAGSLARWTAEAAHAVDPLLALRARMQGGDALLLDESTRRAARAFAGVLQQAPERLRLELGRPSPGEELVVAGESLGVSPASRRMLDDLRRFADVELAICIIGEPGSGKDLCAKALHAMSGRATLPHVVIDCPTLRRETAASELFGHVRGAFTGATTDHAGLLERAGEGVLQLDGIKDLDLSIQAMLLRAFQARSFLPVGGLHERQLSARLVVTSDRPLAELVESSLLREDLSQRLAGVSLRVPPLRERGDDAILFAREALQRLARQFNRRLRLSRAAEKYIRDHHWPGNVRELKSAVTRAAVMAGGEEVGADSLHAPDLGAAGGLLLPADSADMNTSSRLVLGALRQLGEAQPGALVSRLGLSRTTVSTSLSALARTGFCERLGKGRATRYRAV